MEGKKKRILITANGERPYKKLLTSLFINSDLRICADGGLRHFTANSLIPDLIIGDLDSLSEDELQEYSDKCRIVKIPRQSDTDLEKTLKYIRRYKPDEVLITGAAGKRFDHMLSNIALLLRYSALYNLKMITNHSVIVPISRFMTFSCEPGETISIFGIDDKTRLTTGGLKFPMKNQTAAFGKYESVSNITEGSEFTIDVRNGSALLVRDIACFLKDFR